MSARRCAAPVSHSPCRGRTEVVAALLMAGAFNAAAWSAIFSLAFLLSGRYG